MLIETEFYQIVCRLVSGPGSCSLRMGRASITRTKFQDALVPITGLRTGIDSEPHSRKTRRSFSQENIPTFMSHFAGLSLAGLLATLYTNRRIPDHFVCIYKIREVTKHLARSWKELIRSLHHFSSTTRWLRLPTGNHPTAA